MTMTGESQVEEPRTLHERAMSLTDASVMLRRRLTPHWAECPVNESGRHELYYGGICHCGWSEGDKRAGSAVQPNRQELTVMLVDIEEEARAAALTAVEEAVARLALYDERDRIVTIAGDTRELRTMADAAEAIRTRALAAITALRQPQEAKDTRGEPR